MIGRDDGTKGAWNRPIVETGNKTQHQAGIRNGKHKPVLEGTARVFCMLILRHKERFVATGRPLLQRTCFVSAD